MLRFALIMTAVVLFTIALGSITVVLMRPEDVPLEQMTADLPTKLGIRLLLLAVVLAVFAAAWWMLDGRE